MLLLGSFQYYLLRSPRTAEQFQQYKLFAILRLGKLLPPSRPQEPTTSNNHALLRMMSAPGLLHTTPSPTDS
ncbi:hypothetical protein CGCF415_v009280 [Colletotrichum fructicola]|uniref:Uncharacterized protein n=1 Tax=Colletotrichum fructicola (strain Nara gc5) TaxID=1213859 RepID=A0A7J6J3H3_COLFN|nr:hypothetical protein CGGC5_v008181 [Colletotrichum fructicola Nara gc5]KAF4900142.1 hypothetical protein CGCFRS4_v003535 [Colletotrichum fructicola]KAF4902693.1 hypothetical protein CGCF415_v009280 [Colletotrichum fructicola]KAF4938615.1 hypothetical protein CGCF245_v004421 [Colletotrichum fructicola]KAF5499400.1 hypothetical protein CGCF413_v007438 [Colletotrichum fructicola]